MKKSLKYFGLVAFAGLFLTAASPANTSSASKERKPLANTEVLLSESNTITLDDVVYPQVVAKLTQRAKEIDATLPTNEPIYLVINSPGGSIDDGLELIENLSSLNRPVKTVSLFSASMGFQTVQGLGERLVVANGTLMSHKARGGFYGEFPGQLDSRYAYYLKRVARMDEKAVARSGGKYTVKSYASLIENEFWCDGSDCVKAGFADRVVQASCDKTLSGVKEVEWDRFLYAGHTIQIVVKTSKCPVITGMIDYNIFIDGEPLYPKVDNVNPPVKPVQDSYYYSTPAKTVAQTLDKSVIDEIMNKVNERLGRLNQKNKNVIKGY